MRCAPGMIVLERQLQETRMLTTNRKANLLAKSGVAVPAFPARRLPIQERHLRKGARVPREELEADAQQAEAVARWSLQIEDMYVVYVAARAASRPARVDEAPAATDRITDADMV